MLDLATYDWGTLDDLHRVGSAAIYLLEEDMRNPSRSKGACPYHHAFRVPSTDEVVNFTFVPDHLLVNCHVTHYPEGAAAYEEAYRTSLVEMSDPAWGPLDADDLKRRAVVRALLTLPTAYATTVIQMRIVPGERSQRENRDNVLAVHVGDLLERAADAASRDFALDGMRQLDDARRMWAEHLREEPALCYARFFGNDDTELVVSAFLVGDQGGGCRLERRAADQVAALARAAGDDLRYYADSDSYRSGSFEARGADFGDRHLYDLCSNALWYSAPRVEWAENIRISHGESPTDEVIGRGTEIGSGRRL